MEGSDWMLNLNFTIRKTSKSNKNNGHEKENILEHQFTTSKTTTTITVKKKYNILSIEV